MSDDFYVTNGPDQEYYKFTTGIHSITVNSDETRMIVDGMTYQVYYENTSLANGGTQEFLLVTPASPQAIHLQAIELTVDTGPDSIQIFEGCTVSANGTALTQINRNRNCTTASVLNVYRDPTVTGDGTEISKHKIFSAQNKTPITSLGDVDEWVLKYDTNYLVRFTNNSGGVGDVEIHMSWHEPSYPQAT